MKMCWAGNGLEVFPEIRRITIKESHSRERHNAPYVDKILTDEIGTVGSGGNSGFQALNLAVQFGAKRILLIGFDMTDRNGLHWYGRNTWNGANNPTESSFRRWVVTFANAAPVLADLGVEVVNTSQLSFLRCFPRRSIEDMLQEWQ